MAWTIKGPDIALKRLPSGKFDFDVSTSGANKGNPKGDASRTHSVMTTLFSRKRGRRPGDTTVSGGYYWDASGLRGSLLWTVTQDRSSTRGQLLACADDAGQQLVNDKFITNLTADAQRLKAGSWYLAVEWSTPSGKTKEAFTL